jgi:hypothetical protein
MIALALVDVWCSQALARLRWSDEVVSGDVDEAIRLMMMSKVIVIVMMIVMMMMMMMMMKMMMMMMTSHDVGHSAPDSITTHVSLRFRYTRSRTHSSALTPLLAFSRSFATPQSSGNPPFSPQQDRNLIFFIPLATATVSFISFSVVVSLQS